MLTVLLNFALLQTISSQSILIRYNSGIATGEMYNLKKNMFASNLQIGAELQIQRALLIDALAGFESVRFDYSDNTGNQIFNTKTNLSFTAQLKHLFLPFKKNNYFFYALGISGAAAVKDKKEIFDAGSKTVVNKNLHGYHIAFLADLGFQLVLSRKVDISISLVAQKDYYRKYRSKTDEIKYERMMLALGFYYKLKN